MAYNVYFLCDECGDVGANYVNQTISYSRMEKIARGRYGWHVSKDGKWVCPYCWERLHNGRKGKWEMNAEFDCPVCHKRLMHIRKEECAAAEGDAWVCPICRHEWVTEFNGTITLDRRNGGQEIEH